MSKNGSNAEIPQVIKFKLIKINPYKEHIILEKFYNVRGQVITLANFWVDKNGKFVKYNTIENNIVIPGITVEDYNVICSRVISIIIIAFYSCGCCSMVFNTEL